MKNEEEDTKNKKVILTLPEPKWVGLYYFWRTIYFLVGIIGIYLLINGKFKLTNFEYWVYWIACLSLLSRDSINDRKFVDRKSAEKLLDKAQGIIKTSG